ncbi:MAG TPA: tetratricopeptide repeat protein [Streptosporangiaceae bacterium]|nr:tetratricopeptide repeat protein [Streptosporangiaceae bacterium]
MSRYNALMQFIGELLELKVHAGSPPLREIIERCDDTPPGITKPVKATLGNLFTRKVTQPPRYELVYVVVTGLCNCADARNLTLNPQERDITWWRGRLERLERDIAVEEFRRREVLLGELRPRVKVWDGTRVPTLAFLTEEGAASRSGFPRALGDSYIPRPDFDEEMQLALQAPAEPFPFLLVYGDAGAGKTTSAWNVAQATLDPHTEVLMPRGGKALAEIALLPDISSVLRPPALIWMDGLSPSDMEHLTSEALECLSNFAVVIGTMSADDCGVILNARGSQAMPVARTAFGRAYPIHIPRDPVGEEAWVTGEDLGFDQDISRVDPRLMWVRVNTADPAGKAIVRSAIDCRRAGLVRPIETEELKRIFPLYLADITREPASSELFEAAIDWAQEPSPNAAPLLQLAHYPESRQAWVASRLLRESEASWELPEFIWPELIDIASPVECFSIFRQAERLDKLTYAAKALAKAAAEQEFYLTATLHRGKVLQELGDLPAAKSCFKAIIDQGVSKEATAAAFLMGMISKEEDDDREAVRYWIQATEMPGELSLMAWFHLGCHYVMSSEREEAVTALDRDFSALDPAFSGATPTVALRASALLKFAQNSRSGLRSDLDEFERRAAQDEDDGSDATIITEALRSYLDSTDDFTSERSPETFSIDLLLDRGRLHFSSLDYRRALESFLRAAASTDRSGPRAEALCMAGDAAAELSLLVEAREYYSQSIECGDPEHSAQAALRLGAILYKENDLSGAIRTWSRALEIGDLEVKAKALFNIGLAHRDADDYVSATRDFESVTRGLDAHSGLRTRAAIILAEIHEDAGADLTTIGNYYQRALDFQDSEYSPIAALAFGKVIYERDRSSSRAVELMRIANESRNIEVRGEGALLLGRILEENESFEDAISAYETAIGTGHTEWKPAGHLYLGLLYGTQGKKNTGMRQLQLAYNSRHPEYRLEAAYWIGMLYWWDGMLGNKANLVSAEEMFRQVFAHRDSEPWAAAGLQLGQVLRARGDYGGAIAVLGQVQSSGIEPCATEARMKLAGLDD